LTTRVSGVRVAGGRCVLCLSSAVRVKWCVCVQYALRLGVSLAPPTQRAALLGLSRRDWLAPAKRSARSTPRLSPPGHLAAHAGARDVTPPCSGSSRSAITRRAAPCGRSLVVDYGFRSYSLRPRVENPTRRSRIDGAR